MGQLRRPLSQQVTVGGGVAGEDVRYPRPGRYQVVPHPEVHRQVVLPLLRTQNMIKNRFYGTLRNYIRFLLAHFSPHG